MEEALLNALMNGALLVVSVAMLAGLCIRCGGPWNRTSIPQNLRDGDANEQYQPTPGFRVVRPAPTVMYQPPIRSSGSGQSSNQLYATSPLQANRHSSFTPTNDGESIPSYENPGSDQDDYVNKDPDDNPDDNPDNYIEVLPDSVPIVSVSLSQNSILSVQSSGHEDYVNVQDDNSDNNSENYINMPDRNAPALTPGMSHESIDSEGNTSADYVNTSVFIDVPASIC